MEKVTTKRMSLYSGRTHPALAEEVAAAPGHRARPSRASSQFANGEIRRRFGESIRGTDVFIMQTHYGHDGRSINDSIMEQLIMIDAAYRASAKRITAVCPFYGYARQDRKAEGREPITARLVADLFKAAGAKRMVSIDLHSGQIQGFFDGPVDHLTAMPVLENYVRKNAEGTGDRRPRRRPHQGRRAHGPAPQRHAAPTSRSSTSAARRARPTSPRPRRSSATSHGRLCILTDDMIDTGGTIVSAAEVLMARGATEVWAMATHGVLSGPAIDRLKNSVITRVVLTNTLPLPSEKQIDKIEVLSIAPLIADALNAVFDDTSVSEIFGGENQA